MPDHPVQLTVSDDLRRSRLTVFFRLLLAIPHFVWLWLWSIAAVFAGHRAGSPARHRPGPDLTAQLPGRLRPLRDASGVVRLARRQPVPVLHGHARIPARRRTARAGTPAPLDDRTSALLAIPALLLAAILGAGFAAAAAARRPPVDSAGPMAVVLFIGGRRSPRSASSGGSRRSPSAGCRAGSGTSVRSGSATARRPRPTSCCSPSGTRTRIPMRSARCGSSAAYGPGRVDDDGRRSRLTVFFRLLLAIPHFVWLALWTVAAFLAAIANFFVALSAAVLPETLHSFLAAYVRYAAHVTAFATLVGEPVPGLHGCPGLSDRHRDRPARAAEPLDHAVPDLPRDPGADRLERAQRRALRRRRPRLVRRARDGPDADGLRKLGGVRGPLPLADERVLVHRHRPLSAREPRAAPTA